MGPPKKREDEKSAWNNIKPFANVSSRAGMKVAGVKEKRAATNGKNVTGLRNMENVICTIWASHCEQSDYIVNVLFMMFLCWLVATNAGQTHLFSALQSCWRRLISTGHRTLASKNEQFKCNNFHRVYRNYYRHLHSINLHFLSSFLAVCSNFTISLSPIPMWAFAREEQLHISVIQYRTVHFAMLHFAIFRFLLILLSFYFQLLNVCVCVCYKFLVESVTKILLHAMVGECNVNGQKPLEILRLLFARSNVVFYAVAL